MTEEEIEGKIEVLINENPYDAKKSVVVIWEHTKSGTLEVEIPIQEVPIIRDTLDFIYGEWLSDLQENCEHDWQREEGTQILEQRYLTKDGQGHDMWAIGSPPPELKKYAFFVWEEYCPDCYMMDTVDCYVVTWDGVLKDDADVKDGGIDAFEYIELVYVDSKREQQIHAQYDIIQESKGFAYLKLREEFSRINLEVDENGDLILEKYD